MSIVQKFEKLALVWFVASNFCASVGTLGTPAGTLGTLGKFGISGLTHKI